MGVGLQRQQEKQASKKRPSIFLGFGQTGLSCVAAVL